MTPKRLHILAIAMLAAAQPAFAQVQPAAVTTTVERDAQNIAIIPPPPPGMGQIVFYRSSRMGFAVNCTVREGEEVLSRLNAGKYFVHATTPGQHDYRVRSESHDVVSVNVREGETSYVRCAIGAGFFVGRPNLSLTDVADYRRRGEGLELMAPRAEQVRASEERRGSRD